MSKWQSIETAPYDTDVLVVDADGDRSIAYLTSGRWNYGGCYHGFEILEEFQPKNWQPLPEPPSE